MVLEGMKMKKPFLLVTVLFLAALASASMIANVRAATDIIDWWSWSGATFTGSDTFYGKDIVAFEEGKSAILFVGVKNVYSGTKPINVSAVGVGFDWGSTYNSTQTTQASPVSVLPLETRVFSVSFTVPNASSVSNLYLHDYKVYVEHMNATTGAKKIVETWIEYYHYFAVYSRDQAAAREMSRIISGMREPEFNSTTAKLLWTKATNETTLGGILYSQGDFAGAKTHYGTALSLRNQAISAEQTTTGGIQDAQLTLIQAQAESFKAQASYLNGLSSMWVLIGVAAVLFAIGYVIRGFATLRKPVAAT